MKIFGLKKSMSLKWGITVEYNRRWGLEVLNPDLPQK
jgi:hypothetical protein